MDPNQWIGPVVTAAVVTSCMSLLAAIIATVTTIATHGKRLVLERELAENKATNDIRLAELKSASDISLAERKFALDRELTEAKVRLDQALADWKRRTELAEHVLADFYKARDIFKFSRSPVSTSNEGKTRKRTEDETEAEASHKDAIYATLERLSKHSSFFAELDARRYRFAALFGIDALKPFELISISHNRIGLATSVLLDNHKSQHMDFATRERFQADIGWDGGENDRVGKAIEEAVAQIETICRPVLESKSP